MTNGSMKRVIAGLGVVTLLALGCNPVLDKKKIETSITSECKSKGLTLKTVDCPAGRHQKQGDTFDCHGTTDDGQALTFTVTQNDHAGNISWKLDGQIMDLAKLGDSIESKVHKAADVKCPSKVKVLKSGDVFKCDVDIEGKHQQVEITVKDNDGNVHWKVL
jgi:hypothetical protein